MKIIILTDNPKKLKNVYTERTICVLRELGALTYPLTKEDILSGMHRDTEIIFSTWGMPHFTEDEIREYFPNVKALFYAAGSVQGFAREFLHSGVRVFSAWAANAVPVAEYTVAEIILSNKGAFRLTRMMAEKKNKEARRIRDGYIGNYGATVGLLGVGMIGSLVAKKLSEMKFDVIAFDPFCSIEKAERLGVRLCSLQEVFERSDVVSNHLANNEETVGMLGYSLFASMKKDATFINTARGAQVKEDDLSRVMSERPDLTALLDVTYPEPPMSDSPLYSAENILLTPHIAGSQGNEQERMSEWMIEEFRTFLSGLETHYEVNEKMLETMA